jgi:malonyl-CoA O-methyltransferase
MNHSFLNLKQDFNKKTVTVFLPGWGFDGRILRLLKPSPNWICPENFIDPQTFTADLLHLLDANNSKPVRIIGWSMGAMLGLDFAASHPEKIESLILISLRSHWPGSEIKELQLQLVENRAAFLKNFYRKCFLGDKESYSNFCSSLESFYLNTMNTERLQQGLHFLSKYILPGPLPGIPVHLVHGKQDIIAPVEEMAVIKDSTLEIIENCGHAVFLAEKCSLQDELKKHAIQAKFSKAAESYDNYAKIQADVAQKLAAKLPKKQDAADIKTILEIGCGTGNFTSLLTERFPAAKIVALDFSPEMIVKATAKLQKKHIEFICAEGEEFLEKSPDESFDLVASNGALQWFSDHDHSLQNIARVLNPGGIFLCSIFGPESLKKLGLGIKTLFGYQGNVAANAFPDVASLQSFLKAYFTVGTAEQELIAKQYESVHDLLVHIRKTGTGGWHHRGSLALTKTRLMQLDNWFVETYGSCTVNYQVHFLQAVK